jgi:glycosyltransferase involved in cell wall biosynthesis
MNHPLLSIVTGTYNRLPYLQQMVQSVRRSLYRGLQYEFVIVDGGSADGTIEWCQAQSDIRLISHGELRGAIRAFCDGAYAATGDYVLLCNDDLEFLDSSILRAIAYLETNPTCGAVAFADDRPANGKAPGFAVQTQTYLRDGRAVHLPYAQVGLFRRWLGDVCGWWGADDPLFISHTYGGDNYLSARIAEFGYTVDAVEGVRVRDLVAQDGLREHNVTKEDRLTAGGGGYYKRFIAPPVLALQPVFDSLVTGGGLRILYLPIFETSIYPHHPIQKRGLREALSRIGQVVQVDYLNEPYDLCELVRNWQPDILVTQCQRQKIDLTAARAFAPNMLCINWNGDVYLDALVDDATINWLKAGNADAQLVVNASALPYYEVAGVKAAYWQCGYEPVNEDLEIENEVDVVFMGSAYAPPWLPVGKTPPRVELVDLLTSLSCNVLLIGTGWVNYPKWNGGNTTYDFELSNAIRRKAKIEVGDNQWKSDTGFVSNRMFDSLAAGGALMLHQHVPMLEHYTGLVAGTHYIEWLNFDDLKDKIAHWLSPKRDKQRERIVKTAQAFVKEYCSFDARVSELFEKILPGVLS